MGSPRGKRTLAADAWRRLFDFVVATAGYRDRVLERLELSPGDARTLSSLDSSQPLTLGELARSWECDASTATWLVDRLERRGLAERRAVPADRRRKAVVLTAAGVQVRAELMAALYAPPPELLELDSASLKLLRDGLVGLSAVISSRPPLAPPSRRVPGLHDRGGGRQTH